LPHLEILRRPPPFRASRSNGSGSLRMTAQRSHPGLRIYDERRVSIFHIDLIASVFML